MERLLILTAAAAALGLAACGPEPTLENVRLEVFEPNCSAASCHGSGVPPRDLTLDGDTVAADLVDVDSSIDGVKLVVAGDADNSLLFQVLTGSPDESVRQMPPGITISQEKVDLVRAWIEAGAGD